MPTPPKECPTEPDWVQEDEDVTVRYQVKYEERDRENEPSFEKTLGDYLTREDAWEVVTEHEAPYMLRVRAMNVQSGIFYRCVNGEEFELDPDCVYHEPE